MNEIDTLTLPLRGSRTVLAQLRETADATKGWIAAAPKAPLFSACATALLLPIASSFAFQLTNLRLYDQGASALMVGVSAGIQALGIAIAAPFTPVVARVIGGCAAILLGVLCTVVATLMMTKGGETFAAGAAARALLAIGIAFIYTIGEALILRFPRLRSRTDGLGLYSSLLVTGAALGPLCVAVVGTRGPLPGMLGIALFLAAGVPLVLYLSADCITNRIEQGWTLKSLRTVWLALAAVFVFGFLESGAVGMLSLHGSLQGYTIGVAVSATAVAAAAAILLQYPISRLVNRANAKTILCAITLASLLGIYLVPASSGHPIALLVAAFVFGGLLDGFYTIGLVIFASNMTSSQILGGNACLVGMCGLGEIMGPVATGAGMSAWGPAGLPIVVAAVLVAFLLLVLAMALQRRLCHARSQP